MLVVHVPGDHHCLAAIFFPGILHDLLNITVIVAVLPNLTVIEISLCPRIWNRAVFGITSHHVEGDIALRRIIYEQRILDRIYQAGIVQGIISFVAVIVVQKVVVIGPPLVQVNAVEAEGINGTVKLSGNVVLPKLAARVL
ncbi:hypothetical protein D3C75_444050 [compost metagenome]